MRRHLTRLACGFWFVITASASWAAQDTPSRPAATSPDRQTRIELALADRGGGQAAPSYSISFRGRPVVLPSRLGIDLAGGQGLGHDSAIEGVRTRTINETYTQHPGKRSRVVDHCEEVVVTLRERAAPAWRWEVVLRAYNDGVALRYRFPAQEGLQRLAIAGDRTQIQLPGNTQAYALPLNGYTTSHEVRYQKKSVAEIPAEWLLGLPLLTELPGTGWVAVMEANLTDYAGMYLARAASAGAVLDCRLSPLPGEPKVAVRADLPHDSPWRVFMIADKVERMVESDLVLNLNAPCCPDRYFLDPARQDDLPLVE